MNNNFVFETCNLLLNWSLSYAATIGPTFAYGTVHFLRLFGIYGKFRLIIVTAPCGYLPPFLCLFARCDAKRPLHLQSSRRKETNSIVYSSLGSKAVSALFSSRNFFCCRVKAIFFIGGKLNLCDSKIRVTFGFFGFLKNVFRVLWSVFVSAL